MKLMFFYRDLQNGGVQKNMLRLAEGLVARGHAVDFLIARSGPNEFAVPEGVRLVRCAGHNPVSLLIELVKQIDQRRPDVLYTAMPNYNGVALLARLVSRHKPRIVISERSHNGAERAHARWGFYRLSLLAAPFLYPLADRILAVSAETAESLAQSTGMARARIGVLHNPVVSPALERAAAEGLHHAWLEPPFELLLAVGRLTGQKDYPTLLAAFALLLAQRPNARLVILGEGEAHAALLAQARALGIAEQVQFAGFDANPYRWMARASLFVLTSLWEGLPTVIIEALACGATIVATDSPSGPRQILGTDGRLGYLAPVGDSAAIAQALSLALDHRLDGAALRAAAQTYSSEAAVLGFDAMLAELVGAT